MRSILVPLALIATVVAVPLAFGSRGAHAGTETVTQLPPVPTPTPLPTPSPMPSAQMVQAAVWDAGPFAK